MRINCEKCNSVYSIAEKIIGSNGRAVKCAKCSHSWMVYPQNKSQVSLKNTSKNSSNIGYLKYLITLLLVTNLTIIFLFFSDNLLNKPNFKSFYGLFDVYDHEGIIIDNFKFKKHNDEIYITGYISNTSAEDKIIPNIRYTLLNENNEIIFSFTSFSSKHVIKPQETWPVNTRLGNVKQNTSFIKIDIGNKLDLLLR
ncbi:MAG: zinc-ribbon domain-containing protein [Rickettsiales bacterium]